MLFLLVELSLPEETSVAWERNRSADDSDQGKIITEKRTLSQEQNSSTVQKNIEVKELPIQHNEALANLFKFPNVVLQILCQREGKALNIKRAIIGSQRSYILLTTAEEMKYSSKWTEENIIEEVPKGEIQLLFAC
ncbi:hypothetical protein TNIN_80381 [Trichonephila inaurata madagascariensis]|uniref:Uncharacterized protein n=1 Tax=Trichonephila inaurata madagascariensis TaxID=2747483 RepID=A0A8X6MJH2_9ARAC|nr:hypothetical protein TNIN_80381 [Trichonephila inaurata madagascariensis]